MPAAAPASHPSVTRRRFDPSDPPPRVRLDTGSAICGLEDVGLLMVRLRFAPSALVGDDAAGCASAAGTGGGSCGMSVSPAIGSGACDTGRDAGVGVGGVETKLGCGPPPWPVLRCGGRDGCGAGVWNCDAVVGGLRGSEAGPFAVAVPVPAA